MKVNVSNTLNYIRTNCTSKPKVVGFRAGYNSKNDTTKTTAPQKQGSNFRLSKLKTCFLGVLVAVSGIIGCSDNKTRVNGYENIQGIEVRYHNVEQETKDSIMTPIKMLKSRLTDKNDFLKDVQIEITKDYASLDSNDAFSYSLKNDDDTDMEKGTSFYSDSKIQKKIVVQEKAHGKADKSLSKATGGEYSTMPAMRHTLMHETGHHFDSFFGHDHNADFALKWDSIVANKENPYSLKVKTEEEIDARREYYYNADLSDKKEFQDAMYKDILHIAQLKKAKSKQIACGIDYYTQGIDFSKPITPEDIDVAEFAREETYANLFAYAMGENNGDKEDFLENFQNSYKVVQKDIKTFIP